MADIKIDSKEKELKVITHEEIQALDNKEDIEAAIVDVLMNFEVEQKIKKKPIILDPVMISNDILHTALQFIDIEISNSYAYSETSDYSMTLSQSMHNYTIKTSDSNIIAQNKKKLAYKLLDLFERYVLVVYPPMRPLVIVRIIDWLVDMIWSFIIMNKNYADFRSEIEEIISPSNRNFEYSPGEYMKTTIKRDIFTIETYDHIRKSEIKEYKERFPVPDDMPELFTSVLYDDVDEELQGYLSALLYLRMNASGIIYNVLLNLRTDYSIFNPKFHKYHMDVHIHVFDDTYKFIGYLNFSDNIYMGKHSQKTKDLLIHIASYIQDQLSVPSRLKTIILDIARAYRRKTRDIITYTGKTKRTLFETLKDEDSGPITNLITNPLYDRNALAHIGDY